MKMWSKTMERGESDEEEEEEEEEQDVHHFRHDRSTEEMTNDEENGQKSAPSRGSDALPRARRSFRRRRRRMEEEVTAAAGGVAAVDDDGATTITTIVTTTNGCCIICADECVDIPARGVTESCTHARHTCATCVQRFVSVEVRHNGRVTGIRCVEPGCAALLEHDDVRCALTSESADFEHYERMLLKRRGGEEVGRSARRTRRKRKAPRLARGGEKGEHQSDGDDDDDDVMLPSDTKRCPKCRHGIEKSMGCDHMTCHKPAGCGAEFCWVCLADYDGDEGVRAKGNEAHAASCPHHRTPAPNTYTYDNFNGNLYCANADGGIRILQLGTYCIAPLGPAYDPSASSPRYVPTSPCYTPTSPAYLETIETAYVPTSPCYTPTSPAYLETIETAYVPTTLCYTPTSPAYRETTEIQDREMHMRRLRTRVMMKQRMLEQRSEDRKRRIEERKRERERQEEADTCKRLRIIEMLSADPEYSGLIHGVQ